MNESDRGPRIGRRHLGIINVFIESPVVFDTSFNSFEKISNIFNYTFSDPYSSSSQSFNDLERNVVEDNYKLSNSKRGIYRRIEDGNSVVEEIEKQIALLKLPKEITEHVSQVYLEEDGYVDAKIESKQAAIFLKDKVNLKENQIPEGFRLSYSVEDLDNENSEVFGKIYGLCEKLEEIETKTSELGGELATNIKHAMLHVAKTYARTTVERCPWYIYWFKPWSEKSKKAQMIRVNTCKKIFKRIVGYLPDIPTFTYNEKFDKLRNAILEAKKHEFPEPGDTALEMGLQTELITDEQTEIPTQTN